MEALVLAPINLNGVRVEAGVKVDVDENTFANLVRKGKLAPAKASEPGLDAANAVAGEPEPENREDEINLSKRSQKKK